VTRRLPRRAYLAIGRLSRTRLVRRSHPALYRRFRGAGLLGRALGCRMIVLHTIGARSGQPRSAALFAFPHAAGRGATRPADVPPGADVFAVVASNGGAGRPPGWHRNLRAEPIAVVEDGARRWTARARVAEGDERAALWRSITAAYAGYDEYQARTLEPIPVVVLEPIGDPGDPGAPGAARA
jgi:deazaflavin-dependent oxidoreductase (nitroreductase family)